MTAEPRRVRYGVMLPQSGRLASAQAVVDVAQAAEALGFDVVSVRDHLIFDGAYISVGMRGEPAGVGDDRTMLEALETLTWAAARTERIGLGTSVLILPNRHPLLLAKQVATLDAMSGGRVILGLGIGPNRTETSADTTLLGSHRGSLSREYDSFGAVGPRGPRMDEYLAAMRLLWREEAPSFEGEYVRFERAMMFPKPVQRPHPPLLVGGRSAAALERAARWDAGWMPSQVTTTEVSDGVARLRSLRTAAGLTGPLPTIGINVHSVIAGTVEDAARLAGPTLGNHFRDLAAYQQRSLSGDPDAIATRIAAYRDAGADYIELKPLVPSVDALVDHLRTFREAILPAVATHPEAQP
jgi:alkanesulfonate monooxygenase SsuD/methylene tetrahydromethanopterin reductase-like flavin-dependent oxidoreductase (luciferase family)